MQRRKKKETKETSSKARSNRRQEIEPNDPISEQLVAPGHRDSPPDDPLAHIQGQRLPQGNLVSVSIVMWRFRWECELLQETRVLYGFCQVAGDMDRNKDLVLPVFDVGGRRT